MMSDLSYHLGEFAIGHDPTDRRHAQPLVAATDRCVLDVGCGCGQTLVTGGFVPGTELYGIDIDARAVEHGRKLRPHLDLRVGRAESIPFPDGMFDLVICRVSLPYTNVPRALAEMHRVLRPGGRVWLLLHSLAMAGDLARVAGLRAALGRAYLYANTLTLHLFGVVIPRPGGQYVSFQTRGGMARLMRRVGFVAFEAADTCCPETFTVSASKQRVADREDGRSRSDQWRPSPEDVS